MTGNPRLVLQNGFPLECRADIDGGWYIITAPQEPDM